MPQERIKIWLEWITVWLIVLSALILYQIIQANVSNKKANILLRTDSIKIEKLNDIQRCIKDTTVENLLKTIKIFYSAK